MPRHVSTSVRLEDAAGLRPLRPKKKAASKATDAPPEISADAPPESSSSAPPAAPPPADAFERRRQPPVLGWHALKGNGIRGRQLANGCEHVAALQLAKVARVPNNHRMPLLRVVVLVQKVYFLVPTKR